MKALINSLKKNHWFKASVAFLTCLMFLTFPSCQKNELNQDPIPDMDELLSSALSKKSKIIYGKVKDVEGNVYKTVKIGKQWWMAENLAYLPEVSPTTVGSPTDPYYYVYGYSGNDVAAAKATDNYKTYGVLYNWTAAMNSCPSGWHLPSDAEWEQLAQFISDVKGPYINYWYISGYYWTNVGDNLKSTSGWNNKGTDDFGFSALPGGGNNPGTGNFGGLTINGWWWSATENSYPLAWCRIIMSDDPGFASNRNGGMGHGLSVRCVKDN